MARQAPGFPFGGFIGKLGNVVGYYSKGKFYVRSLPPKRKRKRVPTPAQENVRKKFRLATEILEPMREMVRVTYRDHAYRETGQAVTFANIMANVIEGSHPDFTIEWSKLLVTKGNLRNVFSPHARRTPHQLVFKWAFDPRYMDGDGSDNTVLVMYIPEMNYCAYEIGPARSEGQAVIDVKKFKYIGMHVYIGMLSADGRQASNSIYLGPM